MDLISILIRAYNCEDTITFALDSAIKQVYHKKEIIIYDDCSTDSTLERIKLHLGKIRKRIKVIKGSKNVGCGEAHNILRKASKGIYFSMLDSDDMYHDDMVIQNLYDNIKDNDYIYGDLVVIHNREVVQYWIYSEYDLLKIPKIIRAREGSNVIPFDHGLHRKSFWIDNNITQKLRIGGDTLACIEACLKRIRMKHISLYTTLYQYGRTRNSPERTKCLFEIQQYIEKNI